MNAIFVLFFMCLIAPPLYADPLSQGLIEAVGLGTVDTRKTKNRIQAKLLAKRAAIVDAQRNLLEMIEGVRLTSGTTVKDAQVESDLIANRVKGLLTGAFIIKENVMAEEDSYLAEVTLGICVTAALENCGARQNLSQIIYAALAKTSPEKLFKTDRESPDIGSGISGLIVDLTDQEFTPHFDVRLVTKAGKEVYGPGHFNPGKGTDWLHWEKDLAVARQSNVVGKSPLVLFATDTTPDSYIILSDEDAVKLYTANLKGGDFLSQGRVIFVIN